MIPLTQMPCRVCIFGDQGWLRQGELVPSAHRIHEGPKTCPFRPIGNARCPQAVSTVVPDAARAPEVQVIFSEEDVAATSAAIRGAQP